MTDDDFEKAKTEKDKTIHILHFAELGSIRPIYFFCVFATRLFGASQVGCI